jgi:hypothetical protein
MNLLAIWPAVCIAMSIVLKDLRKGNGGRCLAFACTKVHWNFEKQLCEWITQPGISLEHQKECAPKDNKCSRAAHKLQYKTEKKISHWKREFPLFEQWVTFRSCLLLKGTYTCLAFIGKGVSGVKGTLVFALAVWVNTAPFICVPLMFALG